MAKKPCKIILREKPNTITVSGFESRKEAISWLRNYPNRPPFTVINLKL